MNSASLCNMARYDNPVPPRFLAPIDSLKIPEPVFVNLLRSPGIDSQPGRPDRRPYLLYRPAMLDRLAELNPGLLYRLQIRALLWQAGTKTLFILSG